MLDIVLYQPEIPPNTGNIIRLCANTGTRLHLIKPLGFALEDKQLLRAGLDYHEFVGVTVHPKWEECRRHLHDRRIFAVSTRGKLRYDRAAYASGDVFLFGAESRGLPSEILESFPEQHRLRVPMVANSRSLNLSNAVAVVVYEAWRQMNFGNAT
jgi:tRNA (cytidine/uridine-2'-O-)-methyltransferase